MYISILKKTLIKLTNNVFKKTIKIKSFYINNKTYNNKVVNKKSLTLKKTKIFIKRLLVNFKKFNTFIKSNY